MSVGDAFLLPVSWGSGNNQVVKVPEPGLMGTGLEYNATFPTSLSKQPGGTEF